ncbi:MAG TPA: hypothetical protein VMX13_07340 [Sedimentisphaerales bacterium]|nr:hypothetical protein [Sedimentisphaerales bacterium]
MRNRILILTRLIGVWLFVVSVPVQADVAYSPKYDELVTWEPFAWMLSTSPGNTIEDGISGAKDQGYTVITRCQDDGPGADSDFEDCTRSEWDSLPDGVGILHIHGHGNSTLIDVCTNIHQDEILDSTTPYWASWTDPDGDGTADSGMGVIDHFSDWGCYVGYVTGTWLGSNFQTTLSDNHAIVHIECCHSSDGASSLLAKCHGRTGFGYTENVNASDAAFNLALLFDLMNGTEPIEDPGTERKAGNAFTYGEDDWRDGFGMRGYNDTTLCPSVVAWDPDDGTGGSGGTGFVEFDTHCDNTVDPNDILSANVTSGSLNIGRFRWAVENSVTLDYKLKFKWCEGDDYQVKITVDASHLAAKDGEQELDGGNSDEYGVAPNLDDFTFEFTD